MKVCKICSVAFARTEDFYEHLIGREICPREITLAVEHAIECRVNQAFIIGSLIPAAERLGRPQDHPEYLARAIIDNLYEESYEKSGRNT